MLSPITLAINRASNPAYGARMLLSSAGVYSGITYTQSGNLTYFNSSGVLQTAAVDTMVLDYDPSTLVLRGYPFWEARTNIAIWSNDITVAHGYGATNATLTASAQSSPISGVTSVNLAALNVGANTGDNSDGFTAPGTVLSNNSSYTQSVFAKPSGTTTFRIRDNASGGTWDFTLSGNGTAPTATGRLTATSIQKCANGFYRLTWSYTTTATAPGNRGDGYCIKTNVADGTTGMLVIGMQIEAGAFPTPLIPTTTAAVTRAAPSCAITGSNFSSWFNSAQGTFVVSGIGADSVTATQGRAFAVSDGTTNNFIEVSRFQSTAQSRSQVIVGGVNQFNSLNATWTIGVLSKIATAYQLNNFAADADGGTVVTDSSGTIPTVDRMTIGSLNAGNYFNGWIQSLANYGARVPDASVKALST